MTSVAIQTTERTITNARFGASLHEPKGSHEVLTMRMTSRQYAAVRHGMNRSRLEREARDVERAAERAALLLGLCPGCGADGSAKVAHSSECEVKS